MLPGLWRNGAGVGDASLFGFMVLSVTLFVTVGMAVSVVVVSTSTAIFCRGVSINLPL
jgi:hypothetical protein